MLPTFEEVSAKYTVGCKTETDKALALLLKALPIVFPHTNAPPAGKPVTGTRNLDDEALLQSGCGWCNEQGRVFIRLCQLNGMPARLIHLFGQHHTTAEFCADGKWAFSDVTFGFVARGKDGKLLSVAESHDQGEGQRYYAQAKAKRMRELAAWTDEQMHMTPARAAAFRDNALSFDPDEFSARKDLAFGVMNYPLPR